MSDERDNAGVVAPPPLIFGIPLVSSILVNRKFGLRFLPSGLARLLGWPLVVGGVGLALWTERTMSHADASINPYTPTDNLATDGPFEYTRNPAYLAMTMIFAGLAMLNNSLPTMILLPIILKVMNRGVIEREEEYLEGKFGGEYLRYKERVRRWI